MTEPATSTIPDPAATAELDALVDLIRGGEVVVLSGAGLSTESGIPDYRGPDGVLRARLPMTIREFLGSEAARCRYWARSQVGWSRIRSARPNRGHDAVAKLEAAGHLRGIITQNVDGLHTAAGARQVIELHGSLDRVICLDCGALTSRARHGERLEAANAGLDLIPRTGAINPDGDAELDDAAVARFRLVGCECCGSDLLKPDVVFFGENVPRPRVERCFEWVDGAHSLLVLGSSLTVMSGLRFVRRAAERAIPVAIVNQGATRGDPLATLRIDAPLGRALDALAHRL